MSLAAYFQHVEDLDLVDTDYLEELVVNGADLNSADQHGNCPVHYVAMAGSVELAEFLFLKGASFSVFDTNGYHPLHLAACADHSPLVEYGLYTLQCMPFACKYCTSMLHSHTAHGKNDVARYD